MQKLLSGFFAVLFLWVSTASMGHAAPRYAALVIDARTGKVLHARNADERRHPASLTKMMTLYVAFAAIERGEISPNTLVKISAKAAGEVPSRIGLRAGQKIPLRYLIRAAAIKSANDASTAIAEAISGSEAAFARRMTATAKAMGMRNTRFRNAHGLTEAGHYSTARDMVLLGRRLFYDFPSYYHLFGRTSVKAGKHTLRNTNIKFLTSYEGADGIKTGFTNAAGHNLVGSARRGSERIIAAVFGMRSSGARAQEMSRLLNLGFTRAPSHARIIRPSPLGYVGNSTRLADVGRKTRTFSPILTRAERPRPRPLRRSDPQIAQGVSRAILDLEAESTISDVIAELAQQDALEQQGVPRPILRVDRLYSAQSKVAPRSIPARPVRLAVGQKGARNWQIKLGGFTQRSQAEHLLLRMSLRAVTELDGSYRRIEPGYDKGQRVFFAGFAGLGADAAQRACARFETLGQSCVPTRLH